MRSSGVQESGSGRNVLPSATRSGGAYVRQFLCVRGPKFQDSSTYRGRHQSRTRALNLTILGPGPGVGSRAR